jgi:hypothetical protein
LLLKDKGQHTIEDMLAFYSWISLPPRGSLFFSPPEKLCLIIQPEPL